MRKIYYDLVKDGILCKTVTNYNEARSWADNEEGAEFFTRVEEVEKPISKEEQEKRDRRIERLAGVGWCPLLTRVEDSLTGCRIPFREVKWCSAKATSYQNRAIKKIVKKLTKLDIFRFFVIIIVKRERDNKQEREENKMKRTNEWKRHCRRFANLAGTDREIWKELATERKEAEIDRIRILNTGRKPMLDPFVGYIAR